MDRSKIRNFSIVAHIDHGKSTLADRILELTKSVAPAGDGKPAAGQHGPGAGAGHHHQGPRRHPGSTPPRTGEDYIFNLIDTPGHVDFNYEVSRSLAACEGAVLVVDASQGIEAQTLANTYLAVDAGLEIVPVINKIDLPAPTPSRVCHEIEDVIGIPAMDAPRISAKTRRKRGGGDWSASSPTFPPPPATENDPLRALIFDSYYDAYRGGHRVCAH